MTRNLVANGDCLVIAAPYVRINLGGFSLLGDGTGSGVTLLNANTPGIDVRNGTITKFQTGINLGSADESEVRRVRAIENLEDGIPIGSRSTVSGCMAHGNGRVGIDVGGASIVRGNTASNNGSHGITPAGSLVTGNSLQSNGGDGIRATPGSGTVAIGNTVQLHDGNGIVATGAVVRENTIVGNQMSGISVSCPSSIVGNTLRSNTGSNIVTTGVGCIQADNATD